LRIALDVKNIGPRDGDEVVQLYVSRPHSKYNQAQKELRGFRRLFIPRGETMRVEFMLRTDELQHWDPERREWRLEEGEIRLLLGSSSADVRSDKMVTVIA
jgi:beta-glucosidase